MCSKEVVVHANANAIGRSRSRRRRRGRREGIAMKHVARESRARERERVRWQKKLCVRRQHASHVTFNLHNGIYCTVLAFKDNNAL